MTLAEFETALDAAAMLPPGERIMAVAGLVEALLGRYSGQRLGEGSGDVTPAEIKAFLAPYHALLCSHPTLRSGVNVQDHDGSLQ